MEVATLRSHEVEARQHTDETKQIALEQLERSPKDDEEAVAVKKERDELRQRDGEAR